MTVSAILWDYDGTLVDSAHKNLMATREILLHLNYITSNDEWPSALSSVEKYRDITCSATNWRHFYKKYFGLSEQQVNEAGALWSEFQLKNQTPVEVFDGIPQLISSLPPIPQGICSLNCEQLIEKELQQRQLLNYFDYIVGYNTKAISQPKPDPESFAYCLQQMKVPTAGTIIYIGDHHEDTQFARNAEKMLRNDNNQLRVVNIAACYSGAKPDLWEMQPDYRAHSVDEVVSIISSFTS
ncbi:MAG: HAD-IA family hydrolase [Gammaproteobacteria bacterium]|jgi:HAD superfamily hydrolase (TIGR01549 family)